MGRARKDRADLLSVNVAIERLQSLVASYETSLTDPLSLQEYRRFLPLLERLERVVKAAYGQNPRLKHPRMSLGGVSC